MIKPRTILDANGRIRFFSYNDFYSRIVKGDDCFICGAKRDSKEFNNEHILPDWLLRKYQLHNQSLSLSNYAKINYVNYKIPCCRECNSYLGKTIEIPISNLLKLSYSEIRKALDNQSNLLLLYKWLMLIFFKTHLKDTTFNWFLNHTVGDQKISDIYDWHHMHHIHCMIRADYTKAIVDTNTIGSIFIVQAIQDKLIEPFDFVDNYESKTIMIRLDEFCVICVLNDSYWVYTLFLDEFQKINGALTPLQLRELFTHIVYLNLYLKERPVYYSHFHKGRYFIKAKIPKKGNLVDDDERRYSLGELLVRFSKDQIPDMVYKEVLLEEIKQGKRNYLFNEHGEFIDHSKDINQICKE